MGIVPAYDLRAEYCSMRAEIDGAIQRIVEGGEFVLGKELEEFEEEFARYCGTRFAVGVASGTAAIQLTLLACGVGNGDEVITVPNTDISTTASVSHCGATTVWVDVDPRTFTMDPTRIEGRLSVRTKAILPVHLFGHPADMGPIMDIARRRGLLVIEDAALATGAEYRGKKVGSIGDAGCFSLAPAKMLGAYGDAGIVTTNDREIAEKVKVLRNYGLAVTMDREQDSGVRVDSPRFIAEGYNERLDTLQAAITRVKLRTFDERLARRRYAAQRYNRLLEQLSPMTPYESPEVKHVYRTYAILVDDRDRVREHLVARGITARPHYVPPLHLQPVYEHLALGPGTFPVAEDIANKLLCLPVFPEITEVQIGQVVMALRECVPRNR